jgi:hypothetical protein
VVVDHAIRDFTDRLVPRPPQATWQASHGRPRRALWIASPIGLGHIQRDLAIARAVRERCQTWRSTGGRSCRSSRCWPRRGDHPPGQRGHGVGVGALGGRSRRPRPARVLRLPLNG